MIQIASSQAALDAIAATMPFGTVDSKPEVNAEGERLIWLEERQLDKLNSVGRSGESYSEAIIRLATLWEGHWTHKPR
jgi:hypothetical protein